jgi:hypothetical protein
MDQPTRICIDCGESFNVTKWTKPRCNRCRYAAEVVQRRAAYATWRDNGGLEHLRNAHLQRKYGMSTDDLASMLATQGGGCAICGTTVPGGRGNWHVDHDHKCCPTSSTCGRCVRGLLCSRCNQALGLFADDAERLRAAIAYLERP